MLKQTIKSVVMVPILGVIFTVNAFACSVSATPNHVPANTNTSVTFHVSSAPANANDSLYMANNHDVVGGGWIGTPTALPSGCSSTSVDPQNSIFTCTANQSDFDFTQEINIPADMHFGYQDITASYYDCTSTTVTVNNPPIAVAGTSLDSNNNLQLDGSLSSDPNNNPLTYTWQIAGESSTRNGKTPSINDLTVGTYNVTLTVSNGLSQSVDKTTVGVVTKRPKATVGMTINNMLINKATGTFLINGRWNATDPLFGTIVNNPLSRLLFELQTGGTSTNPIYGVVGESTHPLTTYGSILR